VALPTITFEFNSAQLRPESQAMLEKLGKSLKKDFPEGNTFLIEGHTDASSETFAYNQELLRERAEAVKDYLIQQMHVKAARLDVSGIGYCTWRTRRGAENRRVVIVNKAS
jgi:outer membrane protein OmpA-like peptidoglycan-associated protein